MPTPPLDPPPSGIVTAPSHPLVLGAVVLLVVNEFALRGHAPGWFTGKASDVAWLVIVPVFLAAVAARLGVGERHARRAALGLAAAAYIALQLWAPLGAFINPAHVADVGDLVALPALFGAVWAWRASARRPRRWADLLALPVMAGVLVADEIPPRPTDASWPCGSDMEWDTNQPLVLQLAGSGPLPLGTDAFVRGLSLVDEDGAEVPLVVADEYIALAVCARDGLRGNTSYTWTIGPWAGGATNEVRFVHRSLPAVRFRTTAADGPPAPTPAACAGLSGGVKEWTDTDNECRRDSLYDTGPRDTSPSDTSPSDTSPSDTGPSDASPSDTGPTDTSPGGGS